MAADYIIHHMLSKEVLAKIKPGSMVKVLERVPSEGGSLSAGRRGAPGGKKLTAWERKAELLEKTSRELIEKGRKRGFGNRKFRT